MSTWVEGRGAATASIPREYLEGKGPYPERLPWLILCGKLLYEFDQAVDRWAGWAAEVVGEWPEDIRAADPDWSALAEMLRYGEELAARAAARHGSGGGHEVAEVRKSRPMRSS